MMNDNIAFKNIQLKCAPVETDGDDAFELYGEGIIGFKTYVHFKATNQFLVANPGER